MGWYIRKGINFGPFRLNLSKSGLGASVGVKGARVSVGPRGSFIHLGRYGVYYRERIEWERLRSQRIASGDGRSTSAGGTGSQLPRADPGPFNDASGRGVIDQINAAYGEIPIWPFVFLPALVLPFILLFLNPLVAIGCAIFGALCTTLAIRRDNRKRTAFLLFELSGAAESRFDLINKAVTGLAQTARLWRMTATQPNLDWKRNAGANHIVRRGAAWIGFRLPHRVASNIIPWCVNLGDIDLYFFPDRVLVKQGSRFAAVSYESLRVEFATSRYIEAEVVPPDAVIVDQTWQYLRRDGGPDRRFANNRQLPVVMYGLLRIQSAGGLDLSLQVSNVRIAEWFAHAFPAAAGSPSSAGDAARGATASASGRRSSQRELPADVVAAYQQFDLPPGAPLDQVESTFRELAKRYHPDRVQHLSRSVRKLAEARMRDLIAARDRIRRHLADSGSGPRT